MQSHLRHSNNLQLVRILGANNSQGQFEIYHPGQHMRKRNKRLINFFFIAMPLTVIVYSIYDKNLQEALPNRFQMQPAPTLAKSPSQNQHNTPQQALINAQIQQQYQKLLNQAPNPDQTDIQVQLEEALLEFHESDDPFDRELAIMKLGELQGEQTLEAMSDALHDPSPIVITQAIRQINHWQDPEQRAKLLLTALQNPDDDIVEQTLLSINMVEDKKLINRLKQLSKHHNSDIKNAAKLTLNLVP